MRPGPQQSAESSGHPFAGFVLHRSIRKAPRGELDWSPAAAGSAGSLTSFSFVDRDLFFQ
jgi:hypothetical protein